MEICLDCQSDHIPEWASEWDNLLSAISTNLSDHEVSVMINRCSSDSEFEMPTFPLQKTKKQKQQNEESGADKSNKPKAKCPHGVQQPQPSVREILSPSTTKNPLPVQENTFLTVCSITVPTIPALDTKHTKEPHSEFLNLE